MTATLACSAALRIRRALVPALLLGALWALGPVPAHAQVEAPILYLQRGQLWSSFFYSKSGAPFSNWSRIDYGMDWPGFRPEMIRAQIGGPASHIHTGGIWFSARDSHDRVIALDDFAMYSFSTNPEPDAKYRVTRHEKVFRNDTNHWWMQDPEEFEELIISEWARNPQWQPQWAGDRQHPIEARREVRQSGGSEREQNYILIEYTITNTSDSTLYDAYAMISYAFGVNTRSWNRLFPNETSGARNNRIIFNPVQRRLFAYALDHLDTAGRDEGYGYFAEGGPQGRGEYLAPAYAGLQILYASPNRQGQQTHVAGHAYKAADSQQDQQGPFAGLSGFEQQHAVLQNPMNAENATQSPSHPMWQRSRIWSMISFGPWDIGPAESVTIAWAEVVGGADYKDVIARQTASGTWEMVPRGTIAAIGLSRFNQNAERALFAFQNDYNVPKPPPAPPFEIRLHDDRAQIGNVITWSDMYDDHHDPDYTGAEAQDLAGYRLYRSPYLPLGPWRQGPETNGAMYEILRQDPRFYDPSTGTYTVLDTLVTQGFSYYYALTAFDTGHESWPVNPQARFPETASNRVPALESSLFANRTEVPFTATVPPTEGLDEVIVVPNPFVSRAGFVNPQDTDRIQFTNIPSPAMLRIYTMRGVLVKTIDHDDGSGVALWDQVTDYGQFVESGVYIFHIETPDGRATRGRFAIVR
jgi:hypothetical protein